MPELSLNISRTFKASIESVFNAWLDPEILAKFMIPGEGMSVPKVEVDAREGGCFSIIMTKEEQEISFGGKYKILDPYSKIVFTWESPFSVEGSTVTLNLSDANPGTNLELIHVKFPDEVTRDNHTEGWDAILNCLDSILS